MISKASQSMLESDLSDFEDFTPSNANTMVINYDIKLEEILLKMAKYK